MAVVSPSPAKNENVCFVCHSDGFLRALKLEAHLIQQATKLKWRECMHVNIKSHLYSSALVEGYLIGEQGDATVLPVYSSYTELWSKAMVMNPFDADLMVLEIHADWDIQYLNKVLSVFDEQIEMWVVDKETHKHEVFHHFLDFSNCLRRLYEYRRDTS